MNAEFLSAEELTQGFAEGTYSPVEATEAALRAIETHDATLNAFRLVDAKFAREDRPCLGKTVAGGQAAKPDRRGAHVNQRFAADQGLANVARLPADQPQPILGRGFAGRCTVAGGGRSPSSERQTPPNSAGKERPTARLPALRAIRGTRELTPGGSSGGAAAALLPAWERWLFAPMAVVRSAIPPPSPTFAD